MIISYSRNFIFIKTKKTAGTTVEAVLATGCGVEDIISKVSGDKYPGSDLLIPGRKSLARPENVDESDDSDDEDELLPKGSVHGFNAHSTAENARDLLDPAFWNSAIKITAERHPYEKAVSQAYYRMFKRNPRNQPFAIHLQKTVHRGGYAGFRMWSADGKPVIDEFVRYEHLRNDLTRVCARLGIPMPAEIPVMKARTRVDRRPAREILTREQKDRVYENCREEFEILGYER
jgi:hypothetical protein